jgi:threonine dehydratase
VSLKCENLQRTGAYKIRGAYYCISKLSDEEKARGVVAASAGNHAQGVAFAAREQGIKATIFTPVGVALPKLQATQAYGAEVILGGESINEPLKAAQAFAADTGCRFGSLRLITPTSLRGKEPWAWKSWTRYLM